MIKSVRDLEYAEQIQKTKMKQSMKKTKAKKGFDWRELKRQSFHAITGIVILALVMLNLIDSKFLGIILVVGALIMYLVHRGIKVPIISWFIKHLERDLGKDDWAGRGSFFFVLGIFLSLILFPRDVAYLSIIVLSLGDSVSTFIGKNYGRTQSPLSKVKLLEGTVAGILFSFVGFLALYLFLPHYSVTMLEGAVACIIAMIVEAIEIKTEQVKLDDNIAIPLVVGAVVVIMRGLF